MQPEPQKYIYLDWNVIQLIKHSSITKDPEVIEFERKINKLKNKFKFPASEAHLTDLCSTQEEHIKYIDEDIKFLETISDCFILAYDPNDPEEKIVPLKENIRNLYNNIRKDIHNNNQSITIPNIIPEETQTKVDMENVSTESIFWSQLDKNDGFFDQNIFRESVLSLQETVHTPDGYKKFMLEAKKLLNNRKKTDTILDQNSDYYKKIKKFFDIGTIKNEKELSQEFIGILEAFLLINGRELKKMTKGERIQTAYMLLELSPLFKETVNKKNKPRNIYTDLKHLFYASDADYYVTMDGNSYKKSKFTAKALNLNLKIVNISEINQKFDTI